MDTSLGLKTLALLLLVLASATLIVRADAHASGNGLASVLLQSA